MIRTKEILAQVLHANVLFDLERRARAGEFDDFESPSATPINDLVAALRAVSDAKPDDNDLRDRTMKLALRAMEGEWDGSPEEAEAWAQTPEGRAAAAELVKAKGG